MNLFYRRPLALFCFLYAAVSLGGCFLVSKYKLILGLVFLGLSLFLLIPCIAVKKHRASLLTAILCLAFSSMALLNLFSRIDVKQDRFEAALAQEIELEMTVLSPISVSASTSSYHVEFAYKEAAYEGILSCEYLPGLEAGDSVKGTVIPRRVEELYFSSEYYYAKGLFFVLTSAEDTLSVVGSRSLDFKGQMLRLNDFLSDALGSVADEGTASMLSALLLGNRDTLRDNVLRDFRRAGLSHILAISGMHLSILVSIMDACLRLLIPKKRRRCVLVLLSALFYTALTGFSLSTVRALIMIGFVYLAFLSGNQNDTVTALFFSLFLILFVSPSAVWDVGLWMSFLAVLGIIVSTYFTTRLAKRLRESRIRPRPEKLLSLLLSAIIVSLFANVFVCLPMCLCFDELSLLSVPATLIVSPLITVLLFLAPLLLLSSLVALLFFLSPILTVACRLLCSLVESIVSLMTQPSGITVSLKYPFAQLIIIPAAILLFLLLILPLRRKFWIPLVPLVAAVLFTGLLFAHNAKNADTLTLDYVSFGESEMLVLTTTSDAVICDISTGANRYLYDSVALTKERFHTEISALVLTHYHTRHITTFSRNADLFVIRNLYLPFPNNSDEYYIMYSLIDVAKTKGVHVILFDRDQVFSPAENMEILLTTPTYLKRSTHPTFALTVSALGKRVTYVAESAHEAPHLLSEIDNTLQESDYIILGTHGPKTKTPIANESLYRSEYLFVADEIVFSFLSPESTASPRIVYGSDKITLRLQR